MIYKLLRADFAKEWKPDKDGNITDEFLKSLKFSDTDIKTFIELGYIQKVNKLLTQEVKEGDKKPNQSK